MKKIQTILKHFESKKSSAIDETYTKERASILTNRTIKGENKLNAIKLAISMIDLTTLEGKDSAGKVFAMCQKAKNPLPGDTSLPHCAAVCVYPRLIRTAKEAVGNSGVKIASVATSFPSGQFPLNLKLEDVKRCIIDGADEIDMVISRGEFLSGNYEYVFNEISKVKEICTALSGSISQKIGTKKEIHLKVILETGELETFDNVRKASILAITAGADFIKTSTGKVQPAATLPVTLVMFDVIKDYFYEVGIKIGMKPAGGIKTTKDALAYLILLNEVLGKEWMTPDLFRLGASSVLNDLLMQYRKQKSGFYQSGDYFSSD
ncbi:MAG: deoxyribose-phosphate aldolase [Ignavibacteriae bacterium]|nr:deoxyribose-phosphate aldolase [Ignavibacteriota bacterium]